jgi:hypothetical protein
VRLVPRVLFFGVALSSSFAWAAPRIAVQPFGDVETEPLRKQVAKIVSRHGFRAVTSLPAVSGTSQYPGLAKHKHLSAFVVADVAQKGDQMRVGFLVWQGIDGSVVGRWEVAASKKKIGKTLAKDFWKHLGMAIEKAMGPPSDYLPPAPPMRINAGSPLDAPIGPT